MNALERWLLSRDLDAQTAMNRLQDAGIISDLCVWPADVSDADIPAAIAHLERTPHSGVLDVPAWGCKIPYDVVKV